MSDSIKAAEAAEAERFTENDGDAQSPALADINPLDAATWGKDTPMPVNRSKISGQGADPFYNFQNRKSPDAL